jgi:hypothetical protein
MIFLVGLESSLECLRFDSLSVAVVDGAIVGGVASELSMVGCDVCTVRAYVQRVCGQCICGGVWEKVRVRFCAV